MADVDDMISAIDNECDDTTSIHQSTISTSLPAPACDDDDTQRPFSLYVANQFVEENLQCSNFPGDDGSSPFKSLEVLLRRPAYFSMFFKHLYETKGCESTISLLFLLRVGAYYDSSKWLTEGRDAKRQAQSIIHTFLSRNAPWTMAVDPAKLDDVETVYGKAEMSVPEAAGLFNALAADTAEVVDAQRDAYQQTLKAEDDDEFLQEDLERCSEHAVTQKILSSIVPQVAMTAQDGSYAMLLTSMAMSMGLDSKCAFLEKISNMQQKDRVGQPLSAQSSSLFKVKGKHQVHIIMGHNFVATHYNSPTFCDYCNGLLWGIGNQGYTCQLCNYNVHKTTCNQNISEYCKGEPRDGAASLFRRVSLKPSFSGSFRQGMRGSSSRCSVEGESPDGELPGKRRLGPLHSVGSNATTCTEASDGVDRASLFTERANNSAAASFYERHRPSSAQAGDSERPAKILRAQSMKVSNGSDKIKPLPTPRDSSTLPRPGRRSIDGVLDGPLLPEHSVNTSLDTAFRDPDLNVDEDLIPWSAVAPDTVLAELSKEEVKRQDLCHELIHTERTHVKKLKVLHHVFQVPLANSELISAQLVDALFPGLGELISYHVELMKGLKACVDADNDSRSKEVGDVLLQFFSSVKTEGLREAASEWVKLRQTNLDFLKQYSTKHPKLTQLITQCEANPMCSRLKLPDLTSVVMQRFTKYPLLLESILKKTVGEVFPAEHENLSKAVELSRRILAQINQDVMNFENNRNLFELQSRIDFKYMDKLTGSLAPYRNVDISNRELIHRGDLKWRQKGKLVSVDTLLFPDVLVLLEHNEEKTRFSLRIREEFTPIVTLKDLLPPREVASDKERRSFLLVWLTSNGSRMHELAAATSDASMTWRVKISDTIAACKGGMVNVTSQSYSKNIKAYMRRAHTPFNRSVSTQDLIDTGSPERHPSHDEVDGEEQPDSPPSSSALSGSLIDGDDSSPALPRRPDSGGGSVVPSSSDHKHGFRSAVMAATFAPRAAFSSPSSPRNSSTAAPKTTISSSSPRTSSPAPSRASISASVTSGRAAITPLRKATPPSSPASRGSPPRQQRSDLIGVLEHCVGQTQNIAILAQDTIKEGQSRGRSIRNRPSTADPSSARLVTAIDTLANQLRMCTELAKMNSEAVSVRPVKERKSSLRVRDDRESLVVERERSRSGGAKDWDRKGFGGAREWDRRGFGGAREWDRNGGGLKSSLGSSKSMPYEPAPEAAQAKGEENEDSQGVSTPTVGQTTESARNPSWNSQRSPSSDQMGQISAVL